VTCFYPLYHDHDDERVVEARHPLLPAITGGTPCLSNGPLQIPRVKALLIKDKPTTKHHQTKETRNRELIDERAWLWLVGEKFVEQRGRGLRVSIQAKVSKG